MYALECGGWDEECAAWRKVRWWSVYEVFAAGFNEGREVVRWLFGSMIMEINGNVWGIWRIWGL